MLDRGRKGGTSEVWRPSRRRILCSLGAALPGALLLSSRGNALAASEERSLSFHHTHTGESLEAVYFAAGAYDAEVLRRIDHLLRDFRSDEVHPIDPRLLDLLVEVREAAGSRGTLEVISGYRTPATNAMLRKGSSGVARRSLHVEGRALDFRLSDTDLTLLRDTALSLKRGGVGFYPGPDFVHLDTGRFRTW